MISIPGVFYSNDPKIVFNDEWLLDDVKIESLKAHKLSIVDLSSEHYGDSGVDHVYHALESAGINFLLLVHDLNDHLKFPRMLYYPYWYVDTCNVLRFPDSYPVTRNFLWSCQNCHPRLHRIYNFLYALNNKWIEKSIFTMYHDKSGNSQRHDDYVLTTELMDQWEEIKQNLPDIKTLKQLKNFWAEMDDPAFTNAYIHLVTETCIIPKVFITEKTWKPIGAQQLFLVFGNPGTIKTLRMLGVDTYDDIIDHSYDLESDWIVRHEKIYESLRKLEDLDLEQIYKDTVDRRLKNAKLCMSGHYGRPYTDLLNAKIISFLK